MRACTSSPYSDVGWGKSVSSIPPKPIQQRIVDAAAAHIERPDQQSILNQHSVFCQAYLPYRNPGDDALTWERLNGDVHLELRAGKAIHPQERCLVQVGLPYGPKCRLVLMHINQLAIRSQSARIEVEDSLSDLVRRVSNLDLHGRNINDVKAQLARLAAADMTLGTAHTDPSHGGRKIGPGYNPRRIDKFRQVFRHALKEALTLPIDTVCPCFTMTGYARCQNCLHYTSTGFAS
jgi:hypothetical protein